MSTATSDLSPSASTPKKPSVLAPAVAVVRSWKVPIALGAFAVIAILLFLIFGRDGVSRFEFSTAGDFVKIPLVSVDRRIVGVIVPILLVLIAAWAAWRASRAKKVPVWVIAAFAVIFMFGLLTWSATSLPVTATSLLVGAVSLSVPLIFGALGGVISERVGVVNVAIEGQLLAGAFVSALVASATHVAVLGLLAAMVAGALVSVVLAAFSIKYWVDQVIVGVVLNVLVAGLTSFLYSTLLSPNIATLNTPPRFERVNIPLLADIPIIGPMLFRQTIIVYLMYIAVFLVWYCLFHTRWGLRLRSSGEHPQAADTVGINVNRTRFWNVTLAGAIAGFGGAYFTLGSVGGFTKELTAGAGYIALAAVIFGRWDPIRATMAALLFGFATKLQSVLGTAGSPIPSEFLLMLPYVITIVAVAGLVGQVRAPAASGKAYVKQ
ncbi:ABC transporter permease [Lacisediminihabitans changchengi]|uniref:ABC transporter permease n=1 Tax=Lacisediminihabitans changchengi TaxID=2787634 RepID=A0A934SNU9_9MICO|nr:ABC transporter permease [Lacisediminihabitans changchengi]MBK4348866.1 ABC transporter permease [Lacisediminihabitans changchengi]